MITPSLTSKLSSKNETQEPVIETVPTPGEFKIYRQAELNRTIASLKANGAILIAGEDGSGKSVLAIAVVEKLQAEGFLVAFVEPTTPKQMLLEIAHQFDIPIENLEGKSLTVDKLKRAIAEFLEENTAFLVLDDAHACDAKFRMWLKQLLGTASPTIIAMGAIAGLLPDIDISISPAGRVLPWISSFFESRMPHRSCTHSLVASGAIAVVGYGAALFNPSFLNLAHALSVGYFFGWFADVFTRGGVEMFWPSPVRCVCPGNRNLRLRTGSNAEYFVLVILIAIALAIFNINNSGGILTQFNRLISKPKSFSPESDR